MFVAFLEKINIIRPAIDWYVDSSRQKKYIINAIILILVIGAQEWRKDVILDRGNRRCDSISLAGQKSLEECNNGFKVAFEKLSKRVDENQWKNDSLAFEQKKVDLELKKLNLRP